MAKAIAYLRVSGRGQIQGDGFPRQREAVNTYAAAHGLTVAAEYLDEGVSGTNDLEDRPGLAALLDRIESNGIATVLVERADRLARDLLVSEVILGQFRDRGVAIVEADGGNELTAGDGDPTRTLIRQVLGAVSQFEKSVIVLKLKAARDRIRQATGRCEGRKPFGFRAGEPETLALMRGLRRKPIGRARKSYQKIAAALTAAGRPTRTGGAWRASTVQDVLKAHGVK